MKKILITTGLYPPDIGGPATYSKILAEELPKRGIETRVLSFGEVRKLPKFIRHFFYFLKILKRGKNVDIIFAQDPVSVGFPSVLASIVLRKKFILKIVGDYAWEMFQNKNQEFVDLEEFQNRKFDFITEIRRLVERWTAKRADLVIVPSRYLEKIVLMWGIKREKIRVVYNSFDAPKINISKEEARRQLGFSGFVLVSAGRLVPWKGFDILIEVFSEIIKEIPSARLYIIGSGPEEKNLKFKIKNLKLEGQVFLVGQVPHQDLLLYLRAGDVFVLNTGYEGFSHLLLEAMAMGIPVITTNLGGNPEIIQDGETGILIGYNDKKALKEAVIRLYCNPELKNKIISNAVEKIKMFSKEKMIEQVFEVLNSL